MVHHATPTNYRPVFSAEHCNLFRSSAIDDGTLESVLWLKEIKKIKTIIDLREKREFHPACKLETVYRLKSIVNPSDSSFIRYHVRFINLAYHWKVFAHRLSWGQFFEILRLMGQHLVRWDYEFQRYGGTCYVDPLGPGGFYCSLVDDCKAQFAQIFRVLADSERFPVVIFCSFGKDRTGIVAALIQMLLGYASDAIVDDYAISEENLISKKVEIKNFFEVRGLRSEFCGSPKHAMTQFINHIQTKYGSAQEYLKICGLTINEINQIKENIIH